MSSTNKTTQRFEYLGKEIIIVNTRVSVKQARRMALNDLVCAVVRMVADAVFLLLAVYLWRSGLIPALLDGLGRPWSWMAAGAVAGAFLLTELPEALTQLGAACRAVLLAWPDRMPEWARWLLDLDTEPDAEGAVTAPRQRSRRGRR